MEVDLTPGEDGTYRLNSTFRVGGPNRVERISVTIRQATALGSLWTNLFRIVAFPPGPRMAR